ncbi:hypothetical protein [Bradyrhizobium cosmicum]|nr:hypothetical protein [Bradyrhizobium cosmicum]
MAWISEIAGRLRIQGGASPFGIQAMPRVAERSSANSTGMTAGCHTE